LTKVKVSGGGRCNVTNHCFNPYEFASHYPRGEKPLKKLFQVFSAQDTVSWFASKKIELTAEDDGRMFPVSNDSQTIIDCFLSRVNALKVRIELSKGAKEVRRKGEAWTVECADGSMYNAKCLLIATGGSPNRAAYNLLVDLGHPIMNPLPSLFTFNDKSKKFSDLMGVAVPNAQVKIAATKYAQRGPVLITHWGLSGPAVIKLSAWAAVHLHEIGYEFTALVNWLGEMTEDDVRASLMEHKKSRGKQKVFSNSMFSLPIRLIQRLYALAEVEESKIWSELSNKTINRLVELLIRCPFEIKGKTTFKEEFVTCGGVDLNEITLDTMESKLQKNLFFAGEVLNIDGETGGFNFQSAWTTAFIAAKKIAQSIQ
jgi:predicted Rossmann fold flavoprotein